MTDFVPAYFPGWPESTIPPTALARDFVLHSRPVRTLQTEWSPCLDRPLSRRVGHWYHVEGCIHWGDLKRLEPCPFCEIVAGRAKATMVADWDDAIAFRPLNPVNPGHALVVPREHIPNYSFNPSIAAAVFGRAAELMQWTKRDSNLITSKGLSATQTVDHFHVHIVPREPGDGLMLPWSNQQKEEA